MVLLNAIIFLIFGLDKFVSDLFSSVKIVFQECHVCLKLQFYYELLKVLARRYPPT